MKSLRSLIPLDALVPQNPLGRILVCTCLLLTFWSSPGLCVSCEDYPLPEEGLLGSVVLPYNGSNIVRQGSLAYIGFEQAKVQVVDLANPQAPVLLSLITSSMPMVNASTWIEPVDNLVFMGGGYYEVPIFDMTDPAAPVAFGQLDVPYEVTATAHSGNLFFVTTFIEGYPDDPNSPEAPVTTFQIFDITKPAAPVELLLIVEGYDYVAQMIAAGDILYMRTHFGVHTFDVSDPTVMTELDFHPFYVNEIRLSGGRLYATNGLGSLFILDVTNPADLILLNTADYGSQSAMTLSVQDKTVMAACLNAGVRIVDVSDPLNCPAPSKWSTVDACNGVLLDGTVSWLLVENTLLAIEANFPAAVPALGSIAHPRSPDEMILVGNLLYQVKDSLRIVDVSDPAAPVLVGTYDDANYYRDLAINGNVVCLVSSSGAVAVDVSDPANPVYLSTLATDQFVSVDASGPYFFLGPQSGTLTAWDLTVPTLPQLLGTQTGIGNYRAYNLVVEDGYAYVGSNFGLQVIDVSDPWNLQLVINGGGLYAYGLDVSGGLVYALTYSHMVTFEFSPSTGLTQLSDVSLPGNNHHAHVDGTQVYVACGSGGIQVLDVVDPANPVRVGAIMSSIGVGCVVTNDSLAIVSTGTYVAAPGLVENYPKVCPLSLPAGTGNVVPARSSDLTVYPNPFNPMTTIYFEMPRSGHAVVEIFSVRGEHITTLGGAHHEAGPREVVWMGRDKSGREVPSGSYFAKLLVDGEAQGAATKMSLIK